MTMSIDPELGDPEGRPDKAPRRISGAKVLAFGLLPAVALSLTLVAGYLKWQDSGAHGADVAQVESVQAASEAVAALLSYQPDTAEHDLASVRDLLTGDFKVEYTQLTEEVVIPAAKQQSIGAVATVPAAATVSATADRAVALVFVNQTVTIGDGAPTDTASSVRVSMEKIDGHWLISDFTPV
jgi:Mce-associated membrane protein